MGKWLFNKSTYNVYCWRARLVDDSTVIEIHHGILGKKINVERYPITYNNAQTELEAKYNNKRKIGYLEFSEIRDDSILSSPVEDENFSNSIINGTIHRNTISYISTYLPNDRKNLINNGMLAMKAKTYTGIIPVTMMGQYKINGLRCFITACKKNDMFKPYGLTFQSCEGNFWFSLVNLEEYLLSVIPENFLDRMCEYGIYLDGEVYLPGHTVNEINSFVKNPECYENKLIQFWCYDIAIQEVIQSKRLDMLYDAFTGRIKMFHHKDDHLNNTDRFLVLPNYSICNDNDAVKFRDKFIDLGFEGLILRNPNVEYQYGRRRAFYMEKFKRHTDGKFVIIDIYKENKRELPILLCKNDVNDATFETRLSNTHEYQKNVLANKDKYINKTLFIEFGERSGVNQVPFHIKHVRFADD